MAELNLPSMDFSSLGQLGNVYKKAQEDQKRQQTLASLGQGGDVDAQTLLKSGDLSLAQLGVQLQNRQVEDAWRRQQAAQAQSNSDRSYQLQAGAQRRLNDPTPEGFTKQADGSYAPIPGGPQDPAYLQKVNDIKKPNNVLQAGDKKIITAAEDELPNLQGTVEGLNRAMELNDKTFTGYSAGTRAALGSRVPGGSLLVDKGAADATTEWQTIMSQEAITTMADSLKGATTDFELNTFKKDLADPTTPPAIRKKIIQRMLTLAERQKAIKERRINELRGGTYFKPQGGQPAAPSQGNGADVMLQQAKEALAQGANRGAVLLRLQQAGISPDGI